MKTRCPHCQKVFSVPDVYKGKRIECLSCHKNLVAEPITETARVQVSKQPAPPRSNRNLWIRTRYGLEWILVIIIGGAGLGWVIDFAFLARKRTQQEIQAPEKVLALREEMEATRKAEFNRLLKIYEEEKRAKERLRREEKKAEFDSELLKEIEERVEESKDREMVLYMKLIENLMKGTRYQPRGREPMQSLLPDEFINEYLALNPKAPLVTGRWQVFETTTIDGWVKKVKRGTIFKTTSGNIYEVVDVVILFEMEVRPKVTVLTDGQFYKLLIKGVDEELLCKKLSPGNKGTKDYINTGGGHWVSKNIEHGKYIRLEDGSLWEVNPIDKIDCTLWLPISSITVIEGKNPLYPYLLINTDDGEKVEAKLLSD